MENIKNNLGVIIISLILGAIISLGSILMYQKIQDKNFKLACHKEKYSQLEKQSGSRMDHSMNDMMHKIEPLAGTEFDKAFLQEMIIHHEGAIKMAETALQKSTKQEIKDLATTIISAQQSEIQQMKSWLTEWFK